MPEVAQATITVTPVMAGAQEKIKNDLTQAAGDAGTAAGEKAGVTMSEAISQKMTGAGTTLTKGLTVPLVAAGTAAVASWKEVDTGLDTIVTKTGASGEALEEMHGILDNIATSIPTDFETAGAAIGEVKTRFGVTGDELEALSAQFVKFAQLNDQDVSGSVDSVSKMMAAFGLSAEDAGRMLDALNVVGQQTGVDVGALSDTVAANAKQFQEMGLTAEEAASFLGSASMAGLDTSTAMMGLKTAMKNATAEGVSLDEKLAEFSETMQGNGSESDKLAAAYELFGTRAGAAIENAVSNGTLDLNDFTASLGEFEGSVDSTFEGTLDPLDQFQTTLNELKILGAEIVDAAGPALTDILSGVAGAAKTLADAWSSLSPQMQDFVIKIAGVAAVAGPLMVGVGKIAGAFTTIKGVFAGGGIGKGISSAGTAASQAAGPVGTAAGSFGTFAGQALKMVAAAAALWIAAQAIQVLVDAAIEITEAGGPAIAVLAGMGAGIVGLMAAAAALGPALTAGAIGIGVFGAAMLGIGAGIDLACTGISKVVDAIGRLVNTISNNAPQINSIVSNIGETVSGVVDSISDGIVKVIDAISGGLSGVLDSVAGVIDSIGNAALNAGTGFEKLAGAVMELVNNTGVLDLAGTLASVAKGVKDISKAASDASSGADAISSLNAELAKLGNVSKTATNTTKLFGTSVSGMMAGVSKAANIGTSSMTGFASSTQGAMNNTRSAISSAQGTMSTFASSVRSAMSSANSAARSLNIAGSIRSVMDSAISSARSKMQTLKSIFSGTKFRFNHDMDLPHFSMSGNFNAEKGTVPKVSVRWYQVAESTPYLFTNPILFGAGEHSDEILYGRDALMRDIREATGGANIINHITINNADNPEAVAAAITKQMKMQLRMA